MTNSLIENTQGITGYQLLDTSYTEETVIFHLAKQEPHLCPACGSENTTATYIKDRNIKGLPTGTKQTILTVKLHRVKCHDCGEYRTEEITFIDESSDRITRSMSKFIIDIRQHMCISSITQFYGLHWWTVKNIEKKYLAKKYEKIDLSSVTKIGIDEVFMGSSIGDNGFLIIVRDLETGSVLHVAKGKKGASLDGFKQELDAAKVTIDAVAVDLAASFTAWIKTNLPDATIVYDHFHVIKLMNDKLSDIRRTTMNELDEVEKKSLKRKRWHYVMNKENLSSDASVELEKCNNIFKSLGTAYWLKESLRNIYKKCDNSFEARVAFKRWCSLALKTNVSQLKTMAKTITKRLDGIISFWDTGITSASMEGFNNKIGWMTRQAYGYRDEEYLILKIFALPKLKKRDSYL